MKYREIITQINNKFYHPIYFLTGEESYYIDKISNHIIKNILNDEEKVFNETIFYGKDTDTNTIISESKQFPFGSQYRTVIVKEAQEIERKEAELRAMFDEPPF